MKDKIEYIDEWFWNNEVMSKEDYFMLMDISSREEQDE